MSSIILVTLLAVFQVSDAAANMACLSNLSFIGNHSFETSLIEPGSALPDAALKQLKELGIDEKVYSQNDQSTLLLGDESSFADPSVWYAGTPVSPVGSFETILSMRPLSELSSPTQIRNRLSYAALMLKPGGKAIFESTVKRRLQGDLEEAVQDSLAGRHLLGMQLRGEIKSYTLKILEPKTLKDRFGKQLFSAKYSLILSK